MSRKTSRILKIEQHLTYYVEVEANAQEVEKLKEYNRHRYTLPMRLIDVMIHPESHGELIDKYSEILEVKDTMEALGI